MVAASLKFTSSINAPYPSYTTPDAGRLDVLNVLNRHEARDEYAWPDFTELDLDFAQAMNFRCALVSDVFVALLKAGVIKITGRPGIMGTPPSTASNRSEEGSSECCMFIRDCDAVLTDSSVSVRMAGRKRHCRHEESSDTEDEPEEEPYYKTDSFIANSMRCLIDSCGRSVGCTAGFEKDEGVSEESFAETVRDSVIEDWCAETGHYPCFMLWRAKQNDIAKTEKTKACGMPSREL
jgi:hypothetical protein